MTTCQARGIAGAALLAAPRTVSAPPWRDRAIPAVLPFAAATAKLMQQIANKPSA